MPNEIRKVLTFWIDRGWHDPADEIEYDASSVLRGYASLNLAVNDLAKRVTVHSVSHSQVIFPSPGQVKQIRLFATVLYTGPGALGIYGPKNPHGPGEITETTTLIELWS